MNTLRTVAHVVWVSLYVLLSAHVAHGNPSFGRTSHGVFSNNDLYRNQVSGGIASPSFDGRADSIYVSMKNGPSSGHWGDGIACALYVIDGADTTFRGQTESRTNFATTTSFAWYGFAFEDSVCVYGDSTYLIACWSDSFHTASVQLLSGAVYIDGVPEPYDYPNWPDPTSGQKFNSVEVAIYCTYIEGGCSMAIERNVRRRRSIINSRSTK